MEGLYYPCSKTKTLVSFAVTAKLICVFVFAYAKSRFSHDEAHIKKYLIIQKKLLLGIIYQKLGKFMHILHQLGIGLNTNEVPGLGPEMMVMSSVIPTLQPNVVFAMSPAKSSKRPPIHILTMVYVA